jgi:hypothetical protein
LQCDRRVRRPGGAFNAVFSILHPPIVHGSSDSTSQIIDAGAGSTGVRSRLALRKERSVLLTRRFYASSLICAFSLFLATSPVFAQAPTITSSAWLDPVVVVGGTNLSGATAMTVGGLAASNVTVLGGGVAVSGELPTTLTPGSYVLTLTTTQTAPSPVCVSPKPVSNWVCVAGGGWVPPSHPLAANVPSPTSTGLVFVLTVGGGVRNLFAAAEFPPVPPEQFEFVEGYNVRIYGEVPIPKFNEQLAETRFAKGCNVSDLAVEVRHKQANNTVTVARLEGALIVNGVPLLQCSVVSDTLCTSEGAPVPIPDGARLFFYAKYSGTDPNGYVRFSARCE